MNDNIEAAITHETQHLNHTIQPNTGSQPGNPATAQILIRCTPHDRDRWKQAATLVGMNLSEYIRDTLNTRTQNQLDCTHPEEQRQTYPWAEFCLKCGHRLRG